MPQNFEIVNRYNDDRSGELASSLKMVLGDKLHEFDRHYRREFQKQDADDPYVRFPALFWQYFKHPLKIWLYARWLDKIGEGRARFTIAEVAQFFNRRSSTVKKWLKVCCQRGLCRGLVYDGNYIVFYYVSAYKICKELDLDFLKPTGLVDFTDNRQRQNLGIAAVEIIQSDLQKSSRFKAQKDCNSQLKEIKKLKERYDYERQLKIKEIKEIKDVTYLEKEELNQIPLKKLPIALAETVKPINILTCGHTTARVLWDNGSAIGVSENFNAYGVSQDTIARISGLSVRQVQRYYSNQYRVDESPIKNYRGYHPVGFVQLNTPVWFSKFDKYHYGKKQIYQRLPYFVKSQNISIFNEIEENRGSKYYQDDYGRVWERKCNIIMPSFQLIRMRYR